MTDLPWEKIRCDCLSINGIGHRKKHENTTGGLQVCKKCGGGMVSHYKIPHEVAQELWEMKQQNTRLRKALEVYGNESNWFTNASLNDVMMFLPIKVEWDENKPWLIAKEALGDE